MNTEEAYEYTFKKVNDLKNTGIEIIVEKTRSPEKEALGILSKELWRKIKIKNLTTRQADSVLVMAKHLNLCGIQFDIGGSGKDRDWEIDWSFRNGKTDVQWEKALEECERRIRSRS